MKLEKFENDWSITVDKYSHRGCSTNHNDRSSIDERDIYSREARVNIEIKNQQMLSSRRSVVIHENRSERGLVIFLSNFRCQANVQVDTQPNFVI